ncbi:TPA: hypothetical protein ACWLUJ_005772 [Pseudomonas aeruginosa]
MKRYVSQSRSKIEEVSAMRGHKLQRVREAVISILTRKKDSADRLLFSPYTHQAMVGGAKLAIMMPLYSLVVWAMGDYEGLRQFLLSATNAEMSQTVSMVIVAGFALGGAVQGLAVAITRKPENSDPWEEGVEHKHTEAEKWYWDQQPDGEELAVREATTERCSPHIDVRWALGDLIKDLQRTENQAGSDLLDHKVMKLLGMPAQGLKPTQKLDDAKRLLALRYGGLHSRLDWDLRTEEIFPRVVRAFVTVRASAKASALEAEVWHRCLIGKGQSEALAVTIAMITRETWTFRS